MKSKDPIVAEVRAAREAYGAKFNFDLRRIAKDLRAKQRSKSRTGGTPRRRSGSRRSAA